MPKSRSPVLGYNHNIRHKGWVFHVQTEDSGVANPHIFTHLFHAGVIVASKRLDYDAESDDDVVKGLMQAQHKAVMKELLHGVYDGKIDVYLGPAAAAEVTPPPVLAAEDAGATIPTAPPAVDEIDLEDGDAGASSPYAQFVVADDVQAVVSGTLNSTDSGRRTTIQTPAVAQHDSDDEINGLLSRLREDTPSPELPEIEDPTPVSPVESPGAWIVARPGQKERPFDRSGPVPVPIRDDMARRVLTPPQIPEVPSRMPSTQNPAAAGVGFRRTSTGANRAPTPAPSGSVPSARPPGSQSVQQINARPQSANPPTRPVPPVAPRTSTTTPVLPRGHGTTPSPTPILSRGSGGLPGARSVSAPPAPTRTQQTTPASRSQPLPPVLPRAQPSAPLGARPAVRPPTPPGGSSRVSTSVTVPPRRPSQDSVVVARPAVVIGAPPTIIGGPSDSTGRRAAHGRESAPPTVQTESLFGQDLISEKSLDEVIMAYLSEESNED